MAEYPHLKILGVSGNHRSPREAPHVKLPSYHCIRSISPDDLLCCPVGEELAPRLSTLRSWADHGESLF